MENMSGLNRSSVDLDVRRRKALYHSWHRGTREMDLLLGRYAEAYIATMSEGDLTAFEELMEVSDKDLMGWLLGKGEVPEVYQTSVYEGVKAYAIANPLN